MRLLPAGAIGAFVSVDSLAFLWPSGRQGARWPICASHEILTMQNIYVNAFHPSIHRHRQTGMYRCVSACAPPPLAHPYVRVSGAVWCVEVDHSSSRPASFLCRALSLSLSMISSACDAGLSDGEVCLDLVGHRRRVVDRGHAALTLALAQVQTPVRRVRHDVASEGLRVLPAERRHQGVNRRLHLVRHHHSDFELLGHFLQLPEELAEAQLTRQLNTLAIS
mmetsp:Transcript_27328/g.78613  ORF Transcript_27328/g.78613 Transcript_27328/m.78613 type:complete len:222 (+) Transcript_27328:638-1303(+)